MIDTRRRRHVHMRLWEARLSGRKNTLSLWGRCLAAVALTVQLAAPTALASGAGLDVARFLCAPAGMLSEDARAEAEAALADLFGAPQDDGSAASHCPLCVLVHGVPLPNQPPALHLVFERQDIAPLLFETGFIYNAQGPPLGLRAPPVTSL